MERINNEVEMSSEVVKVSNQIYGQDRRSRLQKQSKFAVFKKLGLGILVLILVLGIAYIVRAQTFRTKFFENTYINGIDASYKTPDEIEQIIRNEISNYNIIIKSRGNADEMFRGADVGLRYVSDNSVANILENQDILSWWSHSNKVTEYEVPTTAALDDVKFKNSVNGLGALDSSKFIAPENAKISDYISGKGYEIVPEIQGNTVDIQKAEGYIRESMLTLKDEINLDTPDADVYAAPSVFSSDEGLKALAAQLNKLTGVSIHYSKGITLDGNTIHEWLTIAQDGSVLLDDEKIKEYVKDTIAKGYDTAYKPKALKTTGGGVVTIKGGDYGWRVNQSVEAGKIKELILAGESTQRDPEFSQKAASLGEHDYGDSYVEVNLAAQKMYLYKDGNMILSSSFVSGNLARGWATPGGAYGVTYTQRNATLKGEGYATPVSYWMPFNRGIGFHDASWRGSFGGDIYKKGGSHGCINLPPSVAKTLYGHISKGYPVLCHFGGGVAETTPEVVPAETEPAPTVAETVAPGETAASTQAVETKSTKQAETEATKPSKQEETKPLESLMPETEAVLSDAPNEEVTENLKGPGEN